MFKTLKRVALLLCVAGALLTGCSTATQSIDATTQANATTLSQPIELTGEPIRIGAIYALSGNNAAIGTNILRGLDFAAVEINLAGGIDGRPIEILRGDTQGDEETARTEAIRLITVEGVQAIVGCHQSTMTEIVAQVCAEYEIPMITAISTVDSISTVNNPYLFRLCPMNSLYLENMFMYMEAQQAQTGKEIQTIAIFVDDSMIGQEAIRCARIYAQEYGMEIVTEIQYTQGIADLTAQVLELKEVDADVVLAESYASDATLLLQTMDALSYEPPILIAKANGFTDPVFLSATQGISEGVTSVVEWNTDMTKGQETNTMFKEIFGVDMNGHAAEAYTAIWTFKSAFEAAEDASGEAVKNALSALDIQGSFPDGPEIILPYDRIKFENHEFDGVMHYNNNIYASVAIAQIQDGEYKTVWPFEYSNEKIVYSEDETLS
ncbi:ABC transporter substrate-binding protein [Bengtsoniella intestinalis]|uniref:ABC transporter substrate-binding protein n=1 Tax=Bengtsoniella intestinalis TaxID=3073143 RepID=UPI00391F4202